MTKRILEGTEVFHLQGPLSRSSNNSVSFKIHFVIIDLKISFRVKREFLFMVLSKYIFDAKKDMKENGPLSQDIKNIVKSSIR